MGLLVRSIIAARKGEWHRNEMRKYSQWIHENDIPTYHLYDCSHCLPRGDHLQFARFPPGRGAPLALLVQHNDSIASRWPGPSRLEDRWNWSGSKHPISFGDCTSCPISFKLLRDVLEFYRIAEYCIQYCEFHFRRVILFASQKPVYFRFVKFRKNMLLSSLGMKPKKQLDVPARHKLC